MLFTDRNNKTETEMEMEIEIEMKEIKKEQNEIREELEEIKKNIENLLEFLHRRNPNEIQRCWKCEKLCFDGTIQENYSENCYSFFCYSCH